MGEGNYEKIPDIHTGVLTGAEMDLHSRKGDDLAKDTGVDLNLSKDYGYDPNHDGSGDTYTADYHESGEVKDPFAVDTGTNLNEYTSGYTGEEYTNFSKDSGSESQLDSTLENFREDKWNDLSVEEQKQSMSDLADHVADVTGNENPPEIVYSDMPEGMCGSYNPETNTIEINENMLHDPMESADTIAHEMWHAWQQQCANDPSSEKGREYQEGFDNYISPEYDFEAYENQMVEAEAREFAQGIKNRLAGKGAA